MNAQRGFSLVETLVASAIALLVGWQLLSMTHAAILGASKLDGRVRARGAADGLEERLTADAATAWSIFVPGNDLDGNRNDDGHEIDFVTEDASHRPLWWAYAYDARAKSVTRYAYAPGEPAIPGERYEPLDAMSAQTHTLDALAHPGSGIYDPLFARSALENVDVPYGWNSLAVGGNHLVAVRIAGTGVERSLLLAAAAAPSHFTVIVTYTPRPSTPAP